MLENYLDAGYIKADEREKSVFKSLLALEDNLLLPYLMGDKLPIDEEMAVLINKIRNLAPTQN